MASMKRRQYEAAFKARVALEAVKGEKTIAQVASEYGVHPNQFRQWKEHLLSVLPELFSDRRKRTDEKRDQVEAELYRQIGQLKVENEWLKKKFQQLQYKLYLSEVSTSSGGQYNPAYEHSNWWDKFLHPADI